MTPVLEMIDVYKELGHRTVLNGVKLELAPGTVTWLAGANGTGKTTLVKVAAGLSAPSRGQVRWFGQTPAARERARLGVLLDGSFLYGELTAEENLLHYARLNGIKQPKSAVAHWLDEVKLQRDKRTPIKTFSKGMRQRLAIARTFLANPELILLDEPYDGLDEANSRRLTGWLEQFAGQGAAILLVSHDPGPFRRLPLQVLRLHQGKLGKGELP